MKTIAFVGSLDDLPTELSFDVIEFGVEGDVQIGKKNKNGLNPPSVVSSNEKLRYCTGMRRSR